MNNEYKNYFHPEEMEGKSKNNNLYYDLPIHLNAMLNEIDDEKDKDMIVQKINTYYDSLNALIKEI